MTRDARWALVATGVALFAAVAACHEGGEAGPCDGVDCSGHGRCLTDGVRAQCDCDEGYVVYGLECILPPSDGDADADADGDADGDIDSDADTDADVDSDVDSDADSDADAAEDADHDADADAEADADGEEECSPPLVRCPDGTCVDLMSDSSNCGFCGSVCAGDAHCVAGTCTT